MDGEGFVRLELRISGNQHGNGLGRVAWQKGKRAGIRLVIAVRGSRGSVHGGEVNGRVNTGYSGFCDGESIAGGSAIAFVMRHVVDRKCRRGVVVRDGPDPVGTVDNRVCRSGE